MNSAAPASNIIALEIITQELDLADCFQTEAPIHLEIGCGDGSFLIQHAEKSPGVNHIGVERLLGRLRKVDRKAARKGLTNIRLIRMEASYVVSYLLPESSVAAIHVYFPDPWPKRKHRRRRLIQEGFPQAASRILKPSGRVHLRTDDRDYFDQMVDVFDGCGLYDRIETDGALLQIQTDFESLFRLQLKPIHTQSYLLK